MCCFSGPVRDVSATRIFARSPAPGRQYLAYQMTYEADAPVAMILPLPVKTPARETGTVRFLDLSGYPKFFGDLEALFFVPTGGAPPGAAGGPEVGFRALPVIEVGDYVASFVPTMAEFRRLDKRFVIPEAAWGAFPAYRDYGFAVFQLKPTAAGRKREVHPMALEFATRLPAGQLFFPTVHIHDGRTAHAREEFDHRLYWQYPARVSALPRVSGVPVWAKRRVEVAYTTADRALDVRRTRGLVAAKEKTAALGLHGPMPNRDVIVAYGV